MEFDGRKRVVIENLQPSLECGRYPVKRCEGELVEVRVDIFCDSHDKLGAVLLFRREEQTDWESLPFIIKEMTGGKTLLWSLSREVFFYSPGLGGSFRNLQHFLTKKFNAGQDISVDLKLGSILLEQASRRVPPDSLSLFWTVPVIFSQPPRLQQRFFLLRTKR
jgi:starch synthase (maltosyl-transferring)